MLLKSPHYSHVNENIKKAEKKATAKKEYIIKSRQERENKRKPLLESKK
jgi:hypothetical protein